MMRRRGVPEEMITGDASNHDKRLAQAGVLRRVLCNVVGDMVERGQIPMPEAVDLVTAIAYDGPEALFFG
jgi:glucuronate isomerase